MTALLVDDRSFQEFALRNWGKVQPKEIETPAKDSFLGNPDDGKKSDDHSNAVAQESS
jgi:hypothetical protein